MILITERELRRTVADRWLAMYRPICESWGDGPWLQVQQGEQLQALGEEPKFDQIADVIGKNEALHWAGLVCSACSRKVSKAVQIEGTEYIDTLICPDCLREALTMTSNPYE